MGSRFVFLAFLALLATLTLSSSALANAKQIFGTGRPLSIRATDQDRRFARTRLGRALNTGEGLNEPGCVQLVGALLTVLAEAAPYLHERDELFKLDPHLIEVLQSQLSTETFAAAAYFHLMLRQIRLNGRLPLPWLQVAVAVNPTVQTIDLGKLRFVAEGVRPIDSVYFTLSVMRERFEMEVERANSTTAASAFGEFRDGYLDHEVALEGLSLVDLTLPEGEKTSGKGALGPLVVADWMPPDPNVTTLSLETLKPRVKVRVKARLAAKQYMDVSRLPKGYRVLLRGRLWEINRSGTELELRDALLFEDRDWSQGTLLANPAVVATCSAAVMDMQGLGTPQPWTGLR